MSGAFIQLVSDRPAGEFAALGEREGLETRHDPGLGAVCRDHPHLRSRDVVVAPDALRCSRDALILQSSAPAALEFDTQPLNEGLRGHLTQILAAAGTHGQKLRCFFLVACHQ